MRPRQRGRLWPAVLVVLSALACHREPDDATRTVGPTPKFPDPTEGLKPRAAPGADAIPAGEVEAVMRAHLQGLGHMERYEYDQAAKAFREVHERAPDWSAVSINLAIA